MSTKSVAARAKKKGPGFGSGGKTVADDLNEFVFSEEDDELTLLMLAVLNKHYDSVQRQLLTGEVSVNKASGSKGHTALFLAAQHGCLHAAVMLLEHNADVNALADVLTLW